MTYAARTKVGADQTKAEIERTLNRYGAERFAYFSEASKAIIVFEAHARRIRFDLPLPEGAGDKVAQAQRARWRACIKAKARISLSESKIETFEEAFLAHVVMPDGRTVAEHTQPRIAAVYEGKEVSPPPNSLA